MSVPPLVMQFLPSVPMAEGCLSGDRTFITVLELEQLLSFFQKMKKKQQFPLQTLLLLLRPMMLPGPEHMSRFKPS